MGSLGTVGVIGRFRPLHKGGALLLESACKKAKKVIIGIGSSNKYDLRNPFTPEETKAMVDAFLFKRFKNYEIVSIPDYGHQYGNEGGKLWRNHILKEFKQLDYFVTGNPYVKELLGKDYKILDPENIIPKEKHVAMRATLVRIAMAKNKPWEKYLPKEVSAYLKRNRLDLRFRKEFGKQTIEETKGKKISLKDSLEEERKHTLH